jgi:uncharacterized protein (TIGR02246 family)
MNASRAGLAGLLVLLAVPALADKAQAKIAAAERASDRRAVEFALERYSNLVLVIDHAGIAALFAPDGELVTEGQPAVRGPEAIDKHLATFKDYHVKSNVIRADSTSVFGSRATQIGRYRQRVELPSHETVEVSGRFEARWIKKSDGRWLFERLTAKPDPPPAKTPAN